MRPLGVRDLHDAAVARVPPAVVRTLQRVAVHLAATQVRAHVRAVGVEHVCGALGVTEHHQVALDRDERQDLPHLELDARRRGIPAVRHRRRLGQGDQLVALVLGAMELVARGTSRSGDEALSAGVRPRARCGGAAPCPRRATTSAVAGGWRRSSCASRGCGRAAGCTPVTGPAGPPIVSANGQNASGSSVPATPIDGRCGGS